MAFAAAHPRWSTPIKHGRTRQSTAIKMIHTFINSTTSAFFVFLFVFLTSSLLPARPFLLLFFSSTFRSSFSLKVQGQHFLHHLDQIITKSQRSTKFSMTRVLNWKKATWSKLTQHYQSLALGSCPESSGWGEKLFKMARCTISISLKKHPMRLQFWANLVKFKKTKPNLVKLKKTWKI